MQVERKIKRKLKKVERELVGMVAVDIQQSFTGYNGAKLVRQNQSDSQSIRPNQMSTGKLHMTAGSREADTVGMFHQALAGDTGTPRSNYAAISPYESY